MTGMETGGPCLIESHLKNNSLIWYFTLFISGRSHVHNRRPNLHFLLAALPRLLHLRLPQQLNRGQRLRSTRFPFFLLARHVQRHGQPDYLLLDECQVSSFPFLNRSCYTTFTAVGRHRVGISPEQTALSSPWVTPA